MYNTLRDTDDTVLIASTNEDFQRMVDTVSRRSIKMELSLNVKKSECMNISKNKSPPICNVKINEHQSNKLNASSI